MKIALLGYGKMGKTIENMAVEKGHTIVFKSTSESFEGDFEKAEVAIEFSTPAAAFLNISKALTAGIPVVSGTTGWLENYEKAVALCRERDGSFIYASNFSVGVNLFFGINKYAAQLMAQWQEYDVSVKEIHHVQKKDAPSGTAISIAQQIIEEGKKADWELDTADGSAAEKKDILKISAERKEDVKGTHIVTYSSRVDSISLEHKAQSRDGFAKGAILAAEWLRGKKGIYNMKDVLGLTEQ